MILYIGPIIFTFCLSIPLFSSTENHLEGTKVGQGQKKDDTAIPPETDTGGDAGRVRTEREARVKKESEARVKKRMRTKKKAAKNGVKVEKENVARVKIENGAEVGARDEIGRKVNWNEGREVEVRIGRGETEVLTERGDIVVGVEVGRENEGIAVAAEVGTD